MRKTWLLELCRGNDIFEIVKSPRSGNPSLGLDRSKTLDIFSWLMCHDRSFPCFQSPVQGMEESSTNFLMGFIYLVAWEDDQDKYLIFHGG